MRRAWLWAAICALILLGGQALAWGREGHAVIADIAEANLTATAQDQVSLLLQEENQTHLAAIASWADDIRRDRPETAPWHYVDIPLGAATYDPGRDCPQNACAVGQLAMFRAVLADQSAPAATRLEALKWVVHLVGDLHQPLHAEDDNDKGGNLVKLAGLDQRGNLHSFWDTGLLQADNGDEASFATDLMTRITPAEAAAWRQGTPVDWLNEAHALAKPAYDLLGDPPAGATIALPASYVAAEEKVMEGQLERAGVRLAEVINEALK